MWPHLTERSKGTLCLPLPAHCLGGPTCHHRKLPLHGDCLLSGYCFLASLPSRTTHHDRPVPSIPMLCVDRGACGLPETSLERILPKGWKVPFRSTKVALEKCPSPPETCVGSWAQSSSYCRSAKAFKPAPWWPMSRAQTDSQTSPADTHWNPMAHSTFQNKQMKRGGGSHVLPLNGKHRVWLNPEKEKFRHLKCILTDTK